MINNCAGIHVCFFVLFVVNGWISLISWKPTEEDGKCCYNLLGREVFSRLKNLLLIFYVVRKFKAWCVDWYADISEELSGVFLKKEFFEEDQALASAIVGVH
jgi:hypothetical protein